MKTRIIVRKGQIALILVDPDKKPWDSDRVAVMELYEGTKCWTLADVRLAKYDVPNEWFNVSADAYHARYTPDSPEDADVLRSLLTEYMEDDKGVFHWCTYEGIVQGHPKVDGYSPGWHTYYPSGYFKRAEAMGLLKEMQVWWEAYEGDPKKAKIPNPKSQMSHSHIWGEIYMRKQGIK